MKGCRIHSSLYTQPAIYSASNHRAANISRTLAQHLEILRDAANGLTLRELHLLIPTILYCINCSEKKIWDSEKFSHFKTKNLSQGRFEIRKTNKQTNRVRGVGWAINSGSQSKEDTCHKRSPLAWWVIDKEKRGQEVRRGHVGSMGQAEWEGGVGGAYDPDVFFTCMKLPKYKKRYSF